MSEKALMDIKEFCSFVNCKISKARKMIFKKEITYYKFGSLIRIKVSDAVKWLESNKVSAKERD